MRRCPLASDELTPEMARELTPSEWLLLVSETAGVLAVADDRYSHNDRSWKAASEKAREAERGALAAWERDRARLAEVTAQRDALLEGGK
jgi:hypothetical protein